MNQKEKKEKKSVIGKALDLANGRYTDEEVNRLYDIVQNPKAYNGKTKTQKRSFRDFSSGGRYTRYEETQRVLRSDERGVRIEEQYKYHDDDGQSGGYKREYSRGREILNLLGFFKN